MLTYILLHADTLVHDDIVTRADTHMVTYARSHMLSLTYVDALTNSDTHAPAC